MYLGMLLSLHNRPLQIASDDPIQIVAGTMDMISAVGPLIPVGGTGQYRQFVRMPGNLSNVKSQESKWGNLLRIHPYRDTVGSIVSMIQSRLSLG